MIRAIIFIPLSYALDSYFVLACMGHIVRRGYGFLTVLSDWDAVDAHLRVGAAQVVILATRTHHTGEEDRVEFVDEEEARLLRQRNAAVVRHAVPAGRRESQYETARLWPRGDDGGFAERFLADRRNSRHTGDT